MRRERECVSLPFSPTVIDLVRVCSVDGKANVDLGGEKERETPNRERETETERDDYFGGQEGH